MSLLFFKYAFKSSITINPHLYNPHPPPPHNLEGLNWSDLSQLEVSGSKVRRSFCIRATLCPIQEWQIIITIIAIIINIIKLIIIIIVNCIIKSSSCKMSEKEKPAKQKYPMSSSPPRSLPQNIMEKI